MGQSCVGNTALTSPYMQMRVSEVLVGGSVTPLVQSDPTRVQLTIQVNGGGTDMYFLPSPLVRVQFGFYQAAQAVPHIFYYSRDGIIVTSDWYGISFLGAPNVCIIELLYRPNINADFGSPANGRKVVRNVR